MMIGEILIIGLELAILASANREKEPKERKESTAHVAEKTAVVERKEPKISNSGERFVACPLKGYQSYYKIGDYGTVLKGNNMPVHCQRTRNNKMMVTLRNGTTVTTFTVERLVALAYLVRPAKGDEKHHRILHKNGDINDNRAVNLMWK